MQTKMSYWVNADGTIVRAESHIAEQNVQPDQAFAYPFQHCEIVGSSLFSFIAGAEVRTIYGMLHKRVLSHARPVSFDYRCDSAGVRRDMTMSLVFDNGLVRYESIVLKETQRAVPIPLTSLTPSVIIAICSNCKKYRYPAKSDDWKEIDLILMETALPEQFDFSHTFCGVCYQRLMDEISSE